MSDNLFEALSPIIQDNTNKIIIFLQLIDMYNLIQGDHCIIYI